MMKSNFEKINYDSVSVTSLLLRHQTKVTRFSTVGPSQSKFLATLVPKRVTSLRCSNPRHSVKATQQPVCV